MLHSFFVVFIIVTCLFLIRKAIKIALVWIRLWHTLDSLKRLYTPFKEAYNNNDFSNTGIVHIRRLGLRTPLHIPIEKDLAGLFMFIIRDAFQYIDEIESELGILYSASNVNLFKKEEELLDKISNELRLIIWEQDGIDRMKKFWGWCSKIKNNNYKYL